MIICSCNVIRDSDIRAAAGRGCKDAESAYTSMGREFECGSCQDVADEIIHDALTNPQGIDQQAA